MSTRSKLHSASTSCDGSSVQRGEDPLKWPTQVRRGDGRFKHLSARGESLLSDPWFADNGDSDE